MKRNIKHTIIILLAAASGITLWLAGPVPQNPEYHRFADTGTLFGIPNFMDVVTNIPFFFIGLAGLMFALRKRKSNRWPDTAMLFTLFAGILLTCFGSGWYHLEPNNATLVWDRISVTLVFMSFFALIMYDYIGHRAGAVSFWVFVPLGILSVLYWHWSESIGQGDLRPYIAVQFFPMLAVPVILLLYRKKTGYLKQLIIIFVAYLAAKLCEQYDDAVYGALGVISGHSAKHLLAALACWYLLKVAKLRQPLAESKSVTG